MKKGSGDSVSVPVFALEREYNMGLQKITEKYLYNEEEYDGGNSKLPDGSMFEFWEDETVYDIVLHVNSTHPDADDRNAGTLKAPLKTIQAAAERAVLERVS